MVSRRFMVATTVLLGALMCATVVQAQRPGGGRFDGGRLGGGRGPGGGDLFGVMLGLLNVEKVQKDVDLLPEQLADIQKARESSRGNLFGGGDGERPNFREMSEKEREEFFAKMRTEAEKRQEELKKKVNEILLPHQSDRLQEIAIQVAGVSALMDDEVARKLGIGEAQKEKMQTVQQEAREQMFARFRPGGQARGERPDFEAIRKQMQEMQKEIETKITGVLTASQKAEWEKLKGKPIELTDEERAQIRGRGGRGGPGGAAGGRFGGGRRGAQGGPGRGRPGAGRPAPDDAP